MEKYSFTKKELVNAFIIYNREVVENPESFGVIDNSEATATSQAEKILSILEEQSEERVTRENKQ